MGESLTVKNMKENFMKHHKDGMSVYKIAEMYKLNPTTVYAKLEDIAIANNTTRESLLRCVHTKYTHLKGRSYNLHETVNPDEILENYTNLLQDIKSNINNISLALKN